MGLKEFFKKKHKSVPETPAETVAASKDQGTLAEDIVEMSNWIVLAMNSSGYKLDYSVQSMKEIDRFFDEQKHPGGLLSSSNRGQILFAIGSFIVKTVYQKNSQTNPKVTLKHETVKS